MLQRTNNRILGAINAAETRRDNPRRARAVNASGYNRYRALTVGLLPADYERLDGMAKAAGLPNGALVRNIVLGYLAKHGPVEHG